MAVISIAPGSVTPPATVAQAQALQDCRYVEAGEAITILEAIYYDSTNNDYRLADASDAGKDMVSGLSFDVAADTEPFRLLTNGMRVKTGSVWTAGDTYYLSKTTPGGIIPQADLTTGMRVFRLLYAIAADEIIVDLKDYGVDL
jgi:hypothetical protein